MNTPALLWLVLAALYLALGLLTAIGQRKRTSNSLLTVASMVFWPAAWIGWYVKDLSRSDAAGLASKR